jgi:hypothetical protein
MQDLRTKRSDEPEEALHYLLDAVSRSHRGCGIALVDDRGRMLAGAGSPRAMWSAVRATASEKTDREFVSLPVEGASEPLRLAAKGALPGRDLGRVAEGVARILRTID